MMRARDPYLIGFAAMTPFFHVGPSPDRLAAKALGGAGDVTIAATSGEARENTVAPGTGLPFEASARSIIVSASITCAEPAFGAPPIRRTTRLNRQSPRLLPKYKPLYVHKH